MHRGSASFGVIEAEQTRAAALLGHSGDARELERELAAGIRAGRFDDNLHAVQAHVRETVREKLLIANPRYLAPKSDA